MNTAHGAGIFANKMPRRHFYSECPNAYQDTQGCAVKQFKLLENPGTFPLTYRIVSGTSPTPIQSNKYEVPELWAHCSIKKSSDLGGGSPCSPQKPPFLGPTTIGEGAVGYQSVWTAKRSHSQYVVLSCVALQYGRVSFSL